MKVWVAVRRARLIAMTGYQLFLFAISPKRFPLENLRYLYEMRLRCFEVAEEKLRADLDTADLVQSRHLSGRLPELETLSGLAPGTFGRALADFIRAHRLEQVYYGPLEHSRIDDVYNYVKKRTRETHDMHHVVLGVGPDEVGEIYVLAFLYSQYRFPEGGIMIALAILVMIFKHPTRADELFTAIFEAWNRGKQAKPFYGVRWERYFEMGLSELRQLVNLRSRSAKT